jgi:hypothetical protein
MTVPTKLYSVTEIDENDQTLIANLMGLVRSDIDSEFAGISKKTRHLLRCLRLKITFPRQAWRCSH